MTSGISFSVRITRAAVANGRSIRERKETATVKAQRIRLSQMKIVEKRFLAVSCPLRSIVCVIMGISTVASSPSPKTRRQRFGIMNARVHAEATVPPPRIDAVNTSRKKPRRRLAKVAPARPPTRLKILFNAVANHHPPCRRCT